MNCFSGRSWGSGSRTVDSSMFERVEENYRKFKRPDAYDFSKDAKTVGVPVSLDSNNYRYAFSESTNRSSVPSKKQKGPTGHVVEPFESRLARSVRRLSKSHVISSPWCFLCPSFTISGIF